MFQSTFGYFIEYDYVIYGCEACSHVRGGYGFSLSVTAAEFVLAIYASAYKGEEIFTQAQAAPLYLPVPYTPLYSSHVPISMTPVYHPPVFLLSLTHVSDIPLWEQCGLFGIRVLRECETFSVK